MMRRLILAAVVALPFAAWGLPSRAEDRLNLRGTTITLQPATRPGAVAEVVMRNVEVNGAFDEGQAVLGIAGMRVVVAFDWNRDGGTADAVTVTPPEGIVCLPLSCLLVVPEGATGVLHLFTADVGM
jgi:hypothetical protein